MNINDLSAKGRATLVKIAKKNGIPESEVLRHMELSVNSNKVTRHQINLKAD